MKLFEFFDRPRTVKEAEGQFGVYATGGSIGGKKDDKPIKTFSDKKVAQAFARRRRKGLSKGERSYYKMNYVVRPVRSDAIGVKEAGSPGRGGAIGPAITHEEIANAWMEVFPNSSVAVGKAFGGGYTFKFRLAKDKSEVASQIMDNDPLNYTALLDENGNWKEWSSSMFVAPEEGSYNVYSSVKFRKKSAKNVKLAQIQMRFAQVKEFVAANADKMHRIQFDIGEKLGTSINEANGLSRATQKYLDSTGGDIKAALDHASMMANMGRDPAWLPIIRELTALSRGAGRESTHEDDDDPVDPQIFGLGDTRSTNELRNQVRGLSDKTLQKWSANNPGFFGSKLAKVQAKLVQDEMNRRQLNMTEADEGHDDTTAIATKDPRLSQMLKKARITYSGRADDDLSALVSMMGDEQHIQDKEIDDLDHHNIDQDQEIGHEEHVNVDQEEEIVDLQQRVKRLEKNNTTEGRSNMNEAEHSNAVNAVLGRLQRAGGRIYNDVTLVRGNEVALLARNGNVRFAIFPDGTFKRAKEFIEFQRDGWELEMKLDKPKQDKVKYKLLAQKIEDAVQMSFPDADPFDQLLKYSDQLERNGTTLEDALNKAAHDYLGVKDYNDYLVQFWDDHASDDPDAAQDNPWR